MQHTETSAASVAGMAVPPRVEDRGEEQESSVEDRESFFTQVFVRLCSLGGLLFFAVGSGVLLALYP